MNVIFLWFLDNKKATTLTTLILLIGGIISLSMLRAEVFPTISPNIITVTVPFPGATPSDVETGITRRVEEAAIGIDGVKRVTSIASENSGQISIEVSDFADRAKVKDDIEAAVNSLANFPPENAEKPLINAPDATGGVTTLVLTGDVSERELRFAAEEVERGLVSEPGISLVSLSGARKYELSIEVSEVMLESYELSFNEVARAVRASSINLTGGEILASSGDMLLRVNDRRENAATFENIVIKAQPDGSQVTVGDVANIVDAFQARQLLNLYNGRPAIFVNIGRSKGEDVLNVKASVDVYLKKYIPPIGIELLQFKDQSRILSERLNLLLSNAIFGFGLVFLFLVLMLDLKLAFWISIGISTAFTGGFILFGVFDITLTMISLFGLLMALGLVVDDAVVIGEKIDSFRSKGFNDRDAAIEGVKSVFSPVFVGVLTTIIAFSPLLFSGGTFGSIARSIPIVVISVLVVSLFEAFFLLPAHLSASGKWSKGILSSVQTQISRTLQDFAHGPLKNLVLIAVRARYATATATLAFFIFCIMLAGNGSVRFVFFPTIEGNTVSATIELEPGAPYLSTETLVLEIEKKLKTLASEIKFETGEEIIESVAITIGGISSSGGGPGATNSFRASGNIGQIQVELAPFGQRRISAAEIEKRWRDKVGAPIGETKISYLSSVGNFGKDIEFELSHLNEAALEEAVNDLKSKLINIEGINQIEDNATIGKQQMVFQLNDAGKAAGLTSSDLARQIRQGFFGEEVQRVQRGREEVKVFVRYPADARRDVQSLDRFHLRLPDGLNVPLNTVADFSMGRAYSSIRRSDGRRIISVSANVDESIITPGLANQLILETILPRLSKNIRGLSFEQAGSAKEQNEDFADLGKSFLIVMLIIYAILATQLQSYLQPAAILVSIPLGLGGAILGHYVLGFPLSFVSMFGMVALSGVAVNSSVVLIDQYNKNKANGMKVDEAAADASAYRFRPVFITTMTTAIGLAPLLFETSPQAQFLIPMAISLGFGVLVSGTIVLLATPAIAAIVDDISSLKMKSLNPVIKSQ